MKDKIIPMASQVENLRKDVTYKIKVFDKIHQHVLKTLRVSADVKKGNQQMPHSYRRKEGQHKVI